jgi:hypothetical protein
MTELLKVVSQNNFRKCFEVWKNRMGQRVASDRNYSEGDNTHTIIQSLK